MGYLLWFGVVALVFVVMHYFTELTGRQKGSISFGLILLIAGAIVYNMKSDQEREHVTGIELKYRHGETVKCRGVDVNASEFSYSDGTQSFIGNKGTAHYQQIFNLRECQ